MKFVAASVVASLFIACGSEPGPNAFVYVAPPTSGDACVGVTGFEVIVSPAGAEPRTTKMRPSSTILMAKDCGLPGTFSLPEVKIDAPVDVTVHGFDGTGTQVRVTGRQPLPDLRGGSARLQLVAGPSLPLLVFHRVPLLDGVPLANVTSMSVSRQMGSSGPIHTITRLTAGDFLETEPGAYGIPADSNDILVEGTDLEVKFTADAMTKTKRITVEKFNGTYYPAR